MTEPTDGAMSTETLCDRARRKTGLEDFGPLGFLEALDRFVVACYGTAALNDIGLRVLPKVIVRHLVNRLHVQDFVRQHPKVGDDALPVALVVTGLPRTGTTLLHNLLALDSRHRFVGLWEALHPVPPEGDGRHSREALIAQAQSWLGGLYELAPQFKGIHPATAEGPEECDALLQNDFVSQHLEDMFHVEAYSRWLDEAQLIAAYRWYSLQLRVLASRDALSRPWVLKSPSHLGNLDALVEIMPGTRIIHCHRHPVEAVASYASLVSTVRRPYTTNMDLEAVGAHALRRCSASMDRALAMRDRTGADRFVDISYPRLVREPLGVIRSLYEGLGWPVTASFEGAMSDWLSSNRQHSHGVHHYDLATFGLDVDLVSATFGPYLERYAWVDDDHARSNAP